MNKQKVAIYCRVSTVEQKEGFSLDAQESILREFALKNGYEVYDVYIDDGYSGKNLERPQIQRLLRDAQLKKFNTVLAWAVDRVSRSNKHVINLIEDVLEPNDINLLISTCNIDSSKAEGKMFISLLSTYAAYERSMIITRVGMGMSKQAEEGYWCGGKVLGYNSNKGLLTVNIKEKKIVINIFSMRASGLGYKAIASRLNALGYVTKNKKQFQINTIKTILNNPIYIGKIRWGQYRNWEEKRRKGKTDPILVAGKHKAIISQELWDKVQEVGKMQRSNNISNKSNNKGEFILSGILRCPQCGSGTVMAKRKMRDGSGHHLYYMCQAYHSKGITACRTNLIDKYLIEEQTMKLIHQIVKNKNILEEILVKTNLDNNDINEDLNVQLLFKEKELIKLNKKYKNLQNEYFSDEIDEKVYNRTAVVIIENIERLEAEIVNINNELDKNNSKFTLTEEIVIEALNNFQIAFENASNEDKRKLLSSLIKKIEVDDSRKRIKDVVFWFSEDSALPQTMMGRTVP